MKNIPNIITCSRIILSIILFFTEPFHLPFYIMYIISGFSDMIDGYIARKTKAASILGAKLDSIADLTMTVVIFIKLYPIVDIPRLIFIWIVIILILRLLSMSIVFIKYHTFGIIHTFANKGSGIILFCFPIFYPFINTSILTYSICALATLSAVEELLIHLTSKKLNINQKSIFHI